MPSLINVVCFENTSSSVCTLKVNWKWKQIFVLFLKTFKLFRVKKELKNLSWIFFSFVLSNLLFTEVKNKALVSYFIAFGNIVYENINFTVGYPYGNI